jgi:hypothetical protein
LTEDNPYSNENYLYTYRAQLENVAIQQINTFDKSLLTLSSAAVGISVVYLGTGSFHLELHTKVFLSLAWTSLLGAILCNLISYITSYYEKIDVIDRVDQILRSGQFNQEIFVDRSKDWTRALNIVSLILFVLGTCLLASFALSSIVGIS